MPNHNDLSCGCKTKIHIHNHGIHHKTNESIWQVYVCLFKGNKNNWLVHLPSKEMTFVSVRPHLRVINKQNQ